MDEKTRKKIMEMHKKGMTTYAIAKQLGLSQTGVKYVLDPKYREHMKQISRKRYQPKSSQPNNTIPSSDIAWLSQHRQSIEKSSRILKGAGVFLYCFTFVLALIAFATIAIYIFPLIFALVGFTIAFILALLYTPDRYVKEAMAALISGFIIGLIIAIVYIAPLANISQYPVSMQVFYPNHPNITITQNCTGFTTSASGYLNGQPINPQNTTECNLPQSMAQYEYNPFNCNITGKNITCITALDANVTWKGTILNVTKR